MADYQFKETVNIRYERVKEWMSLVYQHFGMPKKVADITADIQAVADLRGVYSHGLLRLESYVKGIENGSLDSKADVELVKDAGALLQMDGHNCSGQYSAYCAMELAIERAEKYGTSTVTVRGGNHMGTMAYFAQMAAKKGMIGMCYTQGAGNNIAPTGGSEPLLGNNPMGFAVPALTKPDVVLDMAMSTVAFGKVAMAAVVGNSIPDNWGFDKSGKPTTNAKECASLQPMGGYKGYGLTFTTTLMTAVLNDCPWGRQQVSLDYYNDNLPLNIAYTMQVINIKAMTDELAFRKRVDAAIDVMKNSQKSPGVQEILVPGELEARKYEVQLKNGIEYPSELIERYNDMCAKWHIDPIA